LNAMERKKGAGTDPFPIPPHTLDRVERCGSLMILGDVDTGKTTLTWKLASILCRGKRVSIIDSDPGQSRLGPPTTIGWGEVRPEYRRWSDVPLKGLAFIGDISPAGVEYIAAIATFDLYRRAARTSDLVIIDTPGLVSGPPARRFIWTLADLLKPGAILGLEKDFELNHITAVFQKSGTPAYLPLRAPELPGKSRVDRQSHRERAFRKYFVEARPISIDMRTTGIRPVNPELSLPPSLVGRLVSLRDGRGRDLALAVVTGQTADRLQAVSPIAGTECVRTLAVGEYRPRPGETLDEVENRERMAEKGLDMSREEDYY